MSRFKRWGQGGLVLTTCLAAWVFGAGAAAAQTHIVQPGETLSDIAGAAGVSMSVLASSNHISNVNVIYAGQQLDIPTIDRPAGPPPADYRVQPGDSLWSIAALRQVTIDQLVAANPDIVNPNYIRADDVIHLPAGAARTSASVSTSSVSTTDVKGMLRAYANEYGLDPALVEAVAWQESGWRQGVKSSAGAYGVMQVLPSTGAWLASDIVGQPLDIKGSADDNIHAGVAYLRYLVDRTSTTQQAVAAYYEGQGNLQKYGILPDAQHYVDNVMAIRAHILVYGTPPGY